MIWLALVRLICNKVSFYLFPFFDVGNCWYTRYETKFGVVEHNKLAWRYSEQNEPLKSEKVFELKVRICQNI